MAVSFLGFSESHTGTVGSVSQASFQFQAPATGGITPRGALVFVHVCNAAGDLVTSVTIGGQAMVRVSGGAAVDTAGEQGRTDLFFLGTDLTSTTMQVVVNRQNTTATMYASCVLVDALTATNVTGIVLLEGDGALTVQSVTDGGAPTNSYRFAAAYSGLAAPPPAATGSTLLTNIDFGNFGCAMVRESAAGTGARNVGFNNATTDDRAAVHVAVRELWNRTDTQTVGAFTLTGNDATFTKASPKEIAAETGAFTLTGQPADLLHNPSIEAGTGAFTLAGQPADARHNVRIEGGTGAFSLIGQPATLTETTPKAITAETGAFTLTGNPATVRRGYALGAEAGAFAAAGQPATLRHNPRIEANTGSFALAGGAPALLRGRYLSGGAGNFTETGQPATFRRTWVVQAATGAFAFTGNPASLTELGAYEIDPIVGAISLTGQSANLAQSQTMPITVGTFTFTGQPATLRQSQALAAETGSFATAGQPAALRQGYRIDAGTGAFSFTGQPATLTKQSAKQLSAAVGVFSLAGQPATLRHNPALPAAAGAFSLAGQPATTRVSSRLSPQVGAFDFTGNSAALTEAGNLQLIADTGIFAITAHPASLTKASTARRRNVLIF